jgi:ketosteroid isomerase-like protein
MKKLVIGLSLLAGCLIPGLAMAGYADDRAEIENLSNRYMVAVDAGDIETVMATWADDGVLKWVGGTENGKDAIRKAMSGFSSLLKGRAPIPENATSRPRTHHQIINHVIDVDADGKHAHSIAYWFAMTNNTPQHDVQLVYFGHYEDTLVKKDGHWLFETRTVYNESEPNRALFYPGLGEKDPRKTASH